MPNHGQNSLSVSACLLVAVIQVFVPQSHEKQA